VLLQSLINLVRSFNRPKRMFLPQFSQFALFNFPPDARVPSYFFRRSNDHRSALASYYRLQPFNHSKIQELPCHPLRLQALRSNEYYGWRELGIRCRCRGGCEENHGLGKGVWRWQYLVVYGRRFCTVCVRATEMLIFRCIPEIVGTGLSG
jgi:hypothetical protein